MHSLAALHSARELVEDLTALRISLDSACVQVSASRGNFFGEWRRFCRDADFDSPRSRERGADSKQYGVVSQGGRKRLLRCEVDLYPFIAASKHSRRSLKYLPMSVFSLMIDCDGKLLNSYTAS